MESQFVTVCTHMCMCVGQTTMGAIRTAAWRDGFTQAVERQEQGGDKEAPVAQNGPVTLKPLSKGSGTPGLKS